MMIKNSITYLLLLIFSINQAFAQESVNNPISINNISGDSIKNDYPRTPFFTHGFIKEFQTGDINNSHFYQPLSEGWKYLFFESKEDIDDELVAKDFDSSAWQDYDIKRGLNLLPESKLKVNEGEFELNLPENNPAVIFRTTFKVPLTWDERQVFIAIEHLSASSLIYVNGRKVGFNEDSKAIGNYDITSACQKGVLNSLAIVSYGYGAASYLESDDSFGGLAIRGDVTVYSVPKLQLSDYIAKISFDPTYKNGLLEFGAVIKTHYLNQKEVKVYFELLDSEGEIVDTQNKFSELNMKDKDTVYFNVPIHNVKRWDSVEPNLFTARVRIQRDMRFTEFVELPIGFKDVCIEDGKLLINGRNEAIKGVKLSQSDMPPTEDGLSTLFQLLKEHEVNTIWVVGAQNSKFYELAAKAGLYIFNVANINSSSSGKELRYGLGNNPELVKSHIARTLNLYEAVKNYPSIFTVVLGSDGSNGYNMYQSYIALEDKKVAVPVAFENATREWNSDIYLARNLSLTDIESYDSPTPQPVVVMVEDVSNFNEIWSAVERNNKMSGVIIENLNSLFSNSVTDNFIEYVFEVGEDGFSVENRRDLPRKEYKLLWSVKYRSGEITEGEEEINFEGKDSFKYPFDKKMVRGIREINLTLVDNKERVMKKDLFTVKY
ncbi:MAG: glycoside hydrolase family 2 TIM barrel-domain containing protein [Rikenellaceae bacterium]